MTITVKQTTTEERYKEMETKWRQYQELYYKTTLPITEIRKRLSIYPNGETQKYIDEKQKEQGIDNYQRGALIRKGEWL